MLTTRGKQVKKIVLNNMIHYAHQKIQQSERKLASLYNEHPVEKTKAGGLNIGSSSDIIDRYDDAISDILKWKKYKEVVEEQQNK